MGWVGDMGEERDGPFGCAKPCPLSRQSVQFQKDLYPPAFAGESCLTVSEWMSGQDCDPVMVEFTEDGIKRIAGAAKSSTAAKVTAKSSGASKEPQTLEEVRG